SRKLRRQARDPAGARGSRRPSVTLRAHSFTTKVLFVHCTIMLQCTMICPTYPIADNIPACARTLMLMQRTSNLKKRRRQMNEHFTRHAEQFMDAAKAAKIPENVQAFAEQGVSR